MTYRANDDELLHPDLWRVGYNHGLRESERMINELRKALYETQESLRQERELIKATDHERAGYVLAMRLLQSSLELDDEEMSACAEFTQPEVIQRVLKAMR